jgi:hypothetical protein
MIPKEEIAAALEHLQPVTPMDANHQAHWWNEGFGLIVYNAQKIWIDNVSSAIVNCKTKKQINQELANQILFWPKNKDDGKFWTEGFGVTIIQEFNLRFSSFQNEVSNIRSI